MQIALNAALTQPTTWRRWVLEELPDAADRFIAVARSADPDLPVPATPPWTVRDVVAHLAAEVPRYLAGVRGHAEPAADRQAVATFNEEAVARRRGEAVSALLSHMSEGLTVLIDEVQGRGDNQPHVPFDGGTAVRADVTLALLLAEFLVHGWDVARVAGSPWGFSPRAASLVLDGAVAVMPGWTSPKARGHSGTYEIRVRQGTAVRFAFESGRVRPARGHERPDTVMTGTSDAIVLTSYGRRSPLRFAISGRLVASGRKPWRALLLPGLVEAP